MESLPKLLERKLSDSQSTPVKDMWNLINLKKRMGTTEGLDKVCVCACVCVTASRVCPALQQIWSLVFRALHD